jgi:glutaredoxin
MIKAVQVGTLGLLAATGLLVCTVAFAQPVYRIVGPDGKVTFSDQPPPAAAPGKAANVSTPAGSTTSGGSTLPFELRQVVSRYPVTLYTSTDCVPCGTGRALLTSRGIPFAEKTVKSNEDIQALQRLSGDTSLPFLTIGGQQIRGFSDTEWSQFLDAAGYPKTSVLPTAFRNPPATPMVAVQTPATPAQTQSAAGNGAPAADAQQVIVNRRPTSPVPAPAPVNNNPAGIRF